MLSRLVLGTVLLLAVAGSLKADPPGSLPLDWPLGLHDGTQYIPGYDVRVMQNFGNRNPDFGDRLHAAVDLARNSGSAANAPVFAAADGIVVCAPTGVGYPGQVVVIEHTLSDGGTLYTQYASYVWSRLYGN